MNELDELYLSILRSGLPVVRSAAARGDLEYCKVETEHLHNLPSLIDEPNMRCHLYYATQSRRVYKEWVSTCGGEAVRHFVDGFYSGAWKRMDEILGIATQDESPR